MTDVVKQCVAVAAEAMLKALEEQDGFLGPWPDGTPRFDGTVDVEALAEVAIATLRERGLLNLGLLGAFADAQAQK